MLVIFLERQDSPLVTALVVYTSDQGDKSEINNLLKGCVLGGIRSHLSAWSLKQCLFACSWTSIYEAEKNTL